MAGADLSEAGQCGTLGFVLCAAWRLLGTPGVNTMSLEASDQGGPRLLLNLRSLFFPKRLPGTELPPRLTTQEGKHLSVCHHAVTDGHGEGQAFIRTQQRQLREAGLLSSHLHHLTWCPSWGASGPPSTLRQVSGHCGLDLGPSGRAAPLRPKRPTGRMPRPAYQAGLMSGAGKKEPVAGGSPSPSPWTLCVRAALWLWDLDSDVTRSRVPSGSHPGFSRGQAG